MRRERFLLLACLAGVWLALMSQAAPAQSWFERPVMPGDLIRGHAKLEKDCSNCHLSFSQGAQSGLCRDCHKEVAKDLDDWTGFHGRAPEMRGQECRHCHADHIGRDADIVQLDHETFPHALIDFALTGAHVAVGCESCHAPDKPFRAAGEPVSTATGRMNRTRPGWGRNASSATTPPTGGRPGPLTTRKPPFP